MAITSPLRICADNPQYFENGANEVVYLTGAHTWNSMVDMGPKGRVTPFDWADYLAFLNQHDHNFVRLWAWNSLGTWNPADEVLTTPWKRTGPGNAADGRPRLDLEELDQDYFNRLASRLAAARESGVYVSIRAIRLSEEVRDAQGAIARCEPKLVTSAVIAHLRSVTAVAAHSSPFYK